MKNVEHWPWRKLFCRESGSFASLSIYVRALAAWLLKICDDEGRIFVGEGEVDYGNALGRVYGGTQSDRRLMRRDIPELIRDGYLVREGCYLVIRNLTAAQGRPTPAEPKPGAGGGSRPGSNGRPPAPVEIGSSPSRVGNESAMSRQRVGDESATSRQRVGDESATSRQRVGDEIETRSELSTRNLSARQKEESRGEEKRGDQILPPFGREARAGAEGGVVLDLFQDPEAAPAVAPSPVPTDPAARYAAAYVAGIEAASGSSYVFPNCKSEHQALHLGMEHARKKKLRGAALLAWITGTARTYRQAKASEPRFEKGYAPSRWAVWLNEGGADVPIEKTYNEIYEETQKRLRQVKENEAKAVPCPPEMEAALLAIRGSFTGGSGGPVLPRPVRQTLIASVLSDAEIEGPR